jgi:hypothetical protein
MQPYDAMFSNRHGRTFMHVTPDGADGDYLCSEVIKGPTYIIRNSVRNIVLRAVPAHVREIIGIILPSTVVRFA